MKPGERIRNFRKNRGLTQDDLANILGYSHGYIADIERGRQKPSREFLERIKEKFGVSSDYILYSGTAAQWDKIEEKLKSKGFSEEDIQEIHPDYLKALYLAGREEWHRGERYGLAVREPRAEYQALPTSTKKLLDKAKKILESKNDYAVKALKANINALFKMISNLNNENENKGGD